MAKQSITCPRCEGKGVIPRYYYNKKGICFLCWGRKTISVDLKDGETKEAAYNRMHDKEKEHLASKPPSIPLPKNVKNKVFDDEKEHAAFGGSKKDGMTPAQINEAIGGLQMVVNMAGPESVKAMAAAAGVKVDGDLLGSIRKHLENGGTMEPKAAPVKDGKIGRETAATTERGTSVKTRYKVVEAGDLIASHDLSGNHNPAFPKELQPRDRTRTASKLQVEQISNELDFNRLGESSLASSGSPIVASDSVVESGNGRILGIKLAYEKSNQASKDYKNNLQQNAASFGIDPKEIEGMKNPVLVRERISDIDRVQFAKEANESGVSSMSAAEQAQGDAAALTGFIIDQYEGGDLKAQKNKPFVNAFMQNVVSAADRNKFITEKTDRDGVKVAELSKDGENRIKNAMFAKAYGDADLLTKKAELDDESNVKNVLQVLEDNAVRYAKVKADMEAGYLHNHDISPDLVAAVKKLDELRANGDNATNYLNQPSFFGSELSEEARAILYYFEKNKRSKANIDNFLGAYMDELEALGDPNEIDMFAAFDDDLSNSNVDKMQLIATAVGRHQSELVESMKRVAANAEPEAPEEPAAASPEQLRNETSEINREVEQLEAEVKALFRGTYGKPVNGVTERFEKFYDEKDNEIINLQSWANEVFSTKNARKPEKQNEYIKNRRKVLLDLLKKLRG